MNGPWHYIEAERLLSIAAGDVSENMIIQTGEHKADVLAAAQVHATLALAAATAEARHTFHSEAGDGFTMSDQYYGEWADAFLAPGGGQRTADSGFQGDH